MSDTQEKKDLTANTNAGAAAQDRYELRIKTGKTEGGVTPTLPVRLLVEWEDVQNVPTVFCIDGGNAGSISATDHRDPNWGKLVNN